ncbi:hypothetical protein ACFLYH_03475 [Candidatus Dependentiae bacterium]
MVQLLETEKVDLPGFNAQKESIISDEKTNLSNGYTGAFIASLLRNAKIEKLKKF